MSLKYTASPVILLGSFIQKESPPWGLEKEILSMFESFSMRKSCFSLKWILSFSVYYFQISFSKKYWNILWFNPEVEMSEEYLARIISLIRELGVIIKPSLKPGIKTFE